MDEKINQAVEKHSQMILDAERHIWKNPETGFREWKTHAYLKEKYESLGYTLHEAGNIPGFYTDIDTGRPGPKILVFGELDALLVPSHPECDKETGAVHACGHNAQSAALLGLAAALREKGVLDGLCGSVRLCAVPAEEGIEIAFRKELRDRGILTFLGGKAEFMARGYFDDCDISFMIHTSSADPGKVSCGGGSNGVIIKNIEYKGKAAHAGGSPHNGINALYAANVGLSAVNALRETFLDSEKIRFHPILTHGGSSVNAIPDKASLESYVRGVSFDALLRENKKINRALAGGAAALGARVEISDCCGFAPLKNNLGLRKVFLEAARECTPEEKVTFTDNVGGGSTDMGDMCCVMPSIHPHVGGASGLGHSDNYFITDPVSACVLSAKVQLILIKLLLENGAARAKEITAGFTPAFGSIKEFVEFRKSIEKDIDAVAYNDDGSITINY